ncbi:MAG TPA: YkgJ family cysteine cluster protein [Polyangiaceae bacterium]
MSSKIPVDRPVVRSFTSKYETEAARWVKSGGHAIVWKGPKTATLVFGIPKDPATDLGLWSLLDLDKWRWKKAEKGPLRGLATSRVPSNCLEVVQDRIDRDATTKGPFKHEVFDCLECGACCKRNEVVLNRHDIAVLKKNRPDVLKKPFARRRPKDGKVRLTLMKNGNCWHLGKDLKCAIYEFRPDPCSSFVVGSECCLSAREEEGVTKVTR